MTIEKVLLVDDNNGQRMTLESILKKSGFDIVTADCGNAALSEAEKEQFAAALLDIKMPDITGIEVLKELKSHQPGIVVIMIFFAKSLMFYGLVKQGLDLLDICRLQKISGRPGVQGGRIQGDPDPCPRNVQPFVPVQIQKQSFERPAYCIQPP